MQFSNVEEALQDRFIMVLLSGAEKENIYMLDLAELKLTKAVNLAESLRSARATAISATGVLSPAEH